MKTIYVLLFGLFLSLGTISCTPESITDTGNEQQEMSTGDPNSDEGGEEDEIEPNN